MKCEICGQETINSRYIKVDGKEIEMSICDCCIDDVLEAYKYLKRIFENLEKERTNETY